MEYQHEIDFIHRTKELLQQYDEYIRLKNLNTKFERHYETTLMINCCVGLLLVPKEIWKNELPTEKINEEKWGIDENWISIETDKSVKRFTEHLRNSVSHYRFEAINKDNKISCFIFTDRLKQAKEDNFKVEVQIINLKKFLLKLSDDLLSIAKQT